MKHVITLRNIDSVEDGCDEEFNSFRRKRGLNCTSPTVIV